MKNEKTGGIMKLKFTKIPKTTKLFNDYLYNFEQVGEFYPRMPYDEGGYNDLFSSLKNRNYHREELAGILRKQNLHFGNAPTTIQSIDRLKKPDTFVIFTGQQVGLFGGPLYTIYKAMTAINLARYLTLTTSHTFLPLFWVEGEDHDFEEVRSTYFINKENNLEVLTYEPKSPFAGQCVGEMILDDTIEELINKFVINTHPSDFKDEMIAGLRHCYAPETTMADAFARWMTRILGRYGLILVDPSDKQIKEMARPVFITSLEKHQTSINPALTDASRRLEAKGYHVQVGNKTDTLDFFYHAPQRLPFTRNDSNHYELKGTERHFTMDELKELLKSEIQNFSPNVILRPIMQDYIFPTAAYVAGPSEIAYFGQYSGIYDIFNVPMPIIYPRKSLTMLEGKVEKILDKYNLKFTDLFTPAQELVRQVLAAQIPQNLQNSIDGSRQAIVDNLEQLKKEAAAFNPNLGPVIKSLERKLKKEFSHAESRITSAIEKKDQIICSQVEKAITNLFPHSHLQERRLNLMTYLCKYSHRLIYSLMEMTCCRHESNHIIWKVEG